MSSMKVLKSQPFLKQLIKTVRGYHLVNKNPIKEAVWENILSNSLSSANIEHEWYNGGHQSGRDITIMNGVKRVGVSCKSCKYNKKQMLISSYRMTKCKSIDDFINCIDVERSNFELYGILSRCEKNEGQVIQYSVHFIPASLIKASSFEWMTRVSKDNGKITCWFTNEVNGVQMSITKSMSNQLWIKIDKDMFQEHCVLANLEIDNTSTFNYANLYDVMIHSQNK